LLLCLVCPLTQGMARKGFAIVFSLSICPRNGEERVCYCFQFVHLLQEETQQKIAMMCCSFSCQRNDETRVMYLYLYVMLSRTYLEEWLSMVHPFFSTLSFITALLGTTLFKYILFYHSSHRYSPPLIQLSFRTALLLSYSSPLYTAFH
jgi:hypothetical protein